MKKREEEMEAVRTTIVGGRPPGSGRRDVGVPRGIEVLVKKASVDEGFKQKLLAQRAAAAEEIGLELDPAESAMLGVIAEEQLAGIIGQTVVPMEQRRVFMGTVAAAMLAVLGVGLASCGKSDATGAGAAGGGSPQTTWPQTEAGPEIREVAGFVVQPAAQPVGPTSTQGSKPGAQTNSAQSVPEQYVVKGLRADPAAQTSTQTAPATGEGADSAPRRPVAVAGATPARPPATSTQTAPPQPATGTQPIQPSATNIYSGESFGVAGATGSRARPATSTQAAPAEGATQSRENEAMVVFGLRVDPPATSTQTAPSQPATETKPGATGAAPAAINYPPVITHNFERTRPVGAGGIGGGMAGSPRPNTRPATATSTAPATSTQPGAATQPTGDSPPRMMASAGILVMPPATTSTQPATTATNPGPVFIGGMMSDRPPAASTQPGAYSGETVISAGFQIRTPPETSTQTAPAPGTAPTSAPLIIRGLRADVPPATSTEPAPPATEPKPAETGPATTTRRGYGETGARFGGGMGPARD